MNLFAEIRHLIIATLEQMVAQEALPATLNFDPITAEPPRDAAHGDMATNAALILTKQARMKPREIASPLAAHLAELTEVMTANIAGWCWPSPRA